MADLVAYSSAHNLPRQHQSPARRLRELEAQFRLAEDPHERALIADALVPEYVTLGDAKNAEEVLGSIGGERNDLELNARITALRAVVAAMNGDPPDDFVSKALESLPALPEYSMALVRGRVGVAYFYARRSREAEEHLLQALWLADVAGLRAIATKTAGVLYGVHYHLTGDLQAARYYAEVQGLEAVAAGDKALHRWSLYQQLDLATTFAEWDRASSIRALLRREVVGESYGNELTLRIADAIIQGQAGNFVAMRGAADAVLKEAKDTADFALGRAMLSVALAGLGSDEEARREARRALALSREPTTLRELAYLTIRRRLAAVLAAYVSMLIGDVVRGSRALDVRGKWTGSIGALARALSDSVLRGSQLDPDDPNLRSVKGYAALAGAAHSVRRLRLRRELTTVRTLTDTELLVLRSAASGKTNSEIARERGVTRNAVERRLMSAYEKLGVKSRAEAIAKLETAKT